MSHAGLAVEGEDSLVREVTDLLGTGFESLPALPPLAPRVEARDFAHVLAETASRLHDNYPYHHPLYAGQMLKPPHPIARMAYQMAQRLNPNNHALDGGRASSQMEKEAVAEIAAMFGWRRFLGHLTGGGTMANLEALWVAGTLTGNATVLASEQAHYTHSRLCGVLRIPFEAVPVDLAGTMDLDALESRLAAGGIGTVVATLGTTATGSCDPLPGLLNLQDRYRFRLHVDAAYGGYYRLAGNLRPETRAAFESISAADSIVVDPHKHGLQPYGCGCVLFRDAAVGALYKHGSPYTYFSSSELHLGEISLECSRPGAAAVALWATQRLLPLIPGGSFAGSLDACREAALDLHGRLKSDPRFIPLFEPELDIVVWAVRAPTPRESSHLAREVFNSTAERDLHLAVATLPTSLFPNVWEGGADTVVALRSCLMKPEHLEWMDAIWERLSEATDAVIGKSGSR